MTSLTLARGCVPLAIVCVMASTGRADDNDLHGFVRVTHGQTEDLLRDKSYEVTSVRADLSWAAATQWQFSVAWPVVGSVTDVSVGAGGDESTTIIGAPLVSIARGWGLSRGVAAHAGVGVTLGPVSRATPDHERIGSFPLFAAVPSLTGWQDAWAWDWRRLTTIVVPVGLSYRTRSGWLASAGIAFELGLGGDYTTVETRGHVVGGYGAHGLTARVQLHAFRSIAPTDDHAVGVEPSLAVRISPHVSVRAATTLVSFGPGSDRAWSARFDIVLRRAGR